MTQRITAEEVIAETASPTSERHYHVVDSNDAAAALGTELEALFASTMQVYAPAHANFGNAIEDLHQAMR